MKNILFQDIIIQIFFFTTVLTGIIQLFYYLFFYARLFKKDADFITNDKAISVVICARNEAENLQKYLHKILEQDYKNFEVVVVNDCSVDDTEFILERLEKKYTNLRHTTIKEDPKFSHGKKLALTVGIKSAKNEQLVLTDADCYPASKDWLKELAGRFNENISIILAYGAFEKEKTFLNKLIRYDNFYNSLQFLSFAKAGFPYMGTGRNLAYKKSLFVKNKGFASHYNILSGDDDLFVNETADKNNAAVVSNTKSFTYTPAKQQFEKWYRQKTRHISSSKRYKFIYKLLLSVEPLSRLFFYLSLIFSLIFFFNYFILIFAITVLITKFLILFLSAKKLDEKDLLFISLFFDTFLPILYLFLQINNILVKRKTWG